MHVRLGFGMIFWKASRFRLWALLGLRVLGLGV